MERDRGWKLNSGVYSNSKSARNACGEKTYSLYLIYSVWINALSIWNNNIINSCYTPKTNSLWIKLRIYTYIRKNYRTSLRYQKREVLVETEIGSTAEGQAWGTYVPLGGPYMKWSAARPGLWTCSWNCMFCEDICLHTWTGDQPASLSQEEWPLPPEMCLQGKVSHCALHVTVERPLQSKRSLSRRNASKNCA